jgi:predicted phosphoribosyltransferase
LQALRQRGAALKDTADEIIAVETEDFHAGISASYADFHQISDAEMLGMLASNS